jgi:hypothetical protein
MKESGNRGEGEEERRWGRVRLNCHVYARVAEENALAYYI